MLDVLAMQKDTLVELRQLRAVVMCVLWVTTVYPRDTDLMRG